MPGTLSFPRVANFTSSSFDFYVTDNFIDYGILAQATTNLGTPSVEQMLAGQDATGVEAPTIAQLDVVVGENLVGTFEDLDFSGGKTYHVWAAGLSYEEGGASLDRHYWPN